MAFIRLCIYEPCGSIQTKKVGRYGVHVKLITMSVGILRYLSALFRFTMHIHYVRAQVKSEYGY